MHPPSTPTSHCTQGVCRANTWLEELHLERLWNVPNGKAKLWDPSWLQDFATSCDQTRGHVRVSLEASKAIRCPLWSPLSSANTIWNRTISVTLAFGRTRRQCGPSTSDGVNGASKHQRREKQTSRMLLPKTLTVFCPLTWCHSSYLILPVHWLWGGAPVCATTCSQ